MTRLLKTKIVHRKGQQWHRRIEYRLYEIDLGKYKIICEDFGKNIIKITYFNNFVV